MSDTTKLVVGIVLAIVVIALVVWLFVSARRRELAASRLEAEQVRIRLEERLPDVQEQEDRASVTAQIAEEARREAEAVAAQAARLEREAEAQRSQAQEMRAEHEALAREADRIDPDVRTDEEGYRLDESGRRLSETTVASALGVGAAALSQDDDEPDLADHENPFPGYAAPPGPEATVAHAAGGVDPEPERTAAPEGTADADWVNGPVDEDAADEVEARTGVDAQAVDWINGDDEEDRVAEADWVNGPVDEDAADEVGARTGVDAQAVDWINGDDEDEGAPFDRQADMPAGREAAAAAAVAEAVEERPGEAPVHDELPGSGPQPRAGSARGEGPPNPLGRRMSTFEEISDGGYGVGSAAPIADGAQPLGHSVMGFRESMTYVPEGEGAHDVQPDVWFYDEEAARRAGFKALDEG